MKQIPNILFPEQESSNTIVGTSWMRFTCKRVSREDRVTDAGMMFDSAIVTMPGGGPADRFAYL